MSKRDDEPFINTDLIDRVDWIVDDSILHDDTWKEWEHDIDKQEEMHLSELYRMLENFTQTDLAVATIVAMENYPFMVLQIVAEYIVNKENK
jgi:hypothetical protein